MIYAKAIVISKLVPIIESLTDLKNEIDASFSYPKREDDMELISETTEILESIITKSE